MFCTELFSSPSEFAFFRSTFFHYLLTNYNVLFILMFELSIIHIHCSVRFVNDENETIYLLFICIASFHRLSYYSSVLLINIDNDGRFKGCFAWKN